MNCQEFWNSLSKPPGGESELGAESQAHLLECPLCAAHRARQRELAAGLRQVARNFSGVKAPARVEARSAQVLSALKTACRRGSNGGAWLAPLAWAAAVAMVLAAGMMLTGARQTGGAGCGAGRRSPQVEAAAAVNGEEVGPEADGFIPLPNAERIGPNEDFNLVRVEVPRSAMMAVGIPVSADRASEPVEADVLLGSDGLVRAVRFME